MISFIPQYHPPAEFAVTFNETGLPAGIDWTVTVRNVTESASGSAIVFLLVNATYGFQVGAVSGYRSIPTNASVMVNGAPLTTVVAFLQRTPPAAAFPVDFVEAGLPSGTAWSVTVRNATYSSVGPVVSTVEINGSFGYRVTPILGFAAHPQHAGFEVQGAPVQVSVNFTQVDLYLARLERVGAWTGPPVVGHGRRGVVQLGRRVDDGSRLQRYAHLSGPRTGRIRAHAGIGIGFDERDVARGSDPLPPDQLHRNVLGVGATGG